MCHKRRFGFAQGHFFGFWSILYFRKMSVFLLKPAQTDQRGLREITDALKNVLRMRIYPMQKTDLKNVWNSQRYRQIKLADSIMGVFCILTRAKQRKSRFKKTREIRYFEVAVTFDSETLFSIGFLQV